MQFVLHSVVAERHDLIIQTLLVANDDVSILVSSFRIMLIYLRTTDIALATDIVISLTVISAPKVACFAAFTQQ